MASAFPSLNVWDWVPGTTVQVTQTFRDYDNQEILAGETLHLVDKNYFPYEEGHTLIFTEKTIRLSGNVPENGTILVNKDNSHFRAIPDTASLLAIQKLSAITG